MAVESVAWDAHIARRSECCLMLLWMKVARSRLSCGCGNLLCDRTLNLEHH